MFHCELELGPGPGLHNTPGSGCPNSNIVGVLTVLCPVRRWQRQLDDLSLCRSAVLWGCQMGGYVKVLADSTGVYIYVMFQRFLVAVITSLEHTDKLEELICRAQRYRAQ